MTIEKVKQLRAQLLTNDLIKKADVEELLDAVERQYATISNWYETLQLIARSGSSWSGRVQQALNEYLFNTTDSATISAVKRLLTQNRDSSVNELLTKLERLDTPLNRHASKSRSNSR